MKPQDVTCPSSSLAVNPISDPGPENMRVILHVSSHKTTQKQWEGAGCYECSAYTPEGIDQLFDAVTRASLDVDFEEKDE